MLDGLKRLFSGAGGPDDGGHDWEGLVPWAQQRQYGFRVVQNEGFVVDGRLGATPWRLEWGPSQRPYIGGHELRIRSELGLSPELQVVVMNVALQEKMEKDVFEQYVEGVQTRIDNQTPPEMRWLVMYPKLGGPELGRLKDRFAAVGNSKNWLTKWVGGPLADALLAQELPDRTPVVLMVARGRLLLRTQLVDPTPAVLDGWLKVFETALAEAREVAEQASAPQAPSTQPSMFTTSVLPLEETPN
jgi:hypothetical protein